MASFSSEKVKTSDKNAKSIFEKGLICQDLPAYVRVKLLVIYLSLNRNLIYNFFLIILLIKFNMPCFMLTSELNAKAFWWDFA